MIYIFLVLGCWLPFAFPSVASWVGPIWATAFWLTVCFYAIAAVALSCDTVKLEDVKGPIMPRHTQIWMIALSATLAGHAVPAVAYLLAVYGFSVALAKKQLAE